MRTRRQWKAITTSDRFDEVRLGIDRDTRKIQLKRSIIGVTRGYV